MTRNRLTLFSFPVGIPIVPAAMTGQHAAKFFEPLDKITSLHLCNNQLFNVPHVRHLTGFEIDQEIF